PILEVALDAGHGTEAADDEILKIESGDRCRHNGKKWNGPTDRRTEEEERNPQSNPPPTDLREIQRKRNDSQGNQTEIGDCHDLEVLEVIFPHPRQEVGGEPWVGFQAAWIHERPDLGG